MERTGKLVGRPAVRCIARRRCGMEVEVEGGASSVTLNYDRDGWRQSRCCCVHLDGPASCCSFLELELEHAVRWLPLADEPLSTLYLFESTTREKLAVGTDETGCSIPQLAGGHGWLLRREIKPNELPADVVLAAYKQGFCMLDGDQLDSGSEFEPEKGSKKP
jgi:hypothetical protein